jgi:hypothetical protein
VGCHEPYVACGHKANVTGWSSGTVGSEGRGFVELSTKAKPGEAVQVSAQAEALLLGKSVDLAAEQQTKTKTALDANQRLTQRNPIWLVDVSVASPCRAAGL